MCRSFSFFTLFYAGRASQAEDEICLPLAGRFCYLSLGLPSRTFVPPHKAPGDPHSGLRLEFIPLAIYCAPAPEASAVSLPPLLGLLPRGANQFPSGYTPAVDQRLFTAHPITAFDLIKVQLRPVVAASHGEAART